MDFLGGLQHSNENQNWFHTKVEQKDLPAHHQHSDLPLHFLNALVLAPEGGPPTSGHVKVMIGACPALWQPFASKQRSLTGQAACETNVNHFCGKLFSLQVATAQICRQPDCQFNESICTPTSETIGPWRIAL